MTSMPVASSTRGDQRALDLGARSRRRRRARCGRGGGRPRGSATARRRARGRSGRRAAASSRTAAGPSRTSTRTAASSQSPAPATMVSAEVLVGGVAGAERGGDAALRPAGRAGGEHVLGHEQHPQRRLPARSCSAVVSPAMPEPTTTTSVSAVQPGVGRGSRRGRTVTAVTVDVVDQPGACRPGPRPAAGPRRAPGVGPGRRRAARGSRRRRRARGEHGAGRGSSTGLAPPAASPAGEQRPGQRQRVPSLVRREVDVAAGQRQPVRLAHGRHADASRRPGRGRAPSGGSASAAGSPSRRRRRGPGGPCSSNLATTVSMPAKWPGRIAPSSSSPSGPAVDGDLRRAVGVDVLDRGRPDQVDPGRARTARGRRRACAGSGRGPRSGRTAAG